MTCNSTNKDKPLLRTRHFSMATTPGWLADRCRIRFSNSPGTAASITSRKAVRNNRAPLTVIGSTFSGNSSDYDGGAIDSRSALTVINSTIIDNVARWGEGGGISRPSNYPITVKNSIVSLNHCNQGANIAASLTPESGYNLHGGDPNVSELVEFDNGTWGYYLLPGSPAIDAALASVAALFDYVGTSRPLGSGYDIGAYEISGPAPPTGLRVIGQ